MLAQLVRLAVPVGARVLLGLALAFGLAPWVWVWLPDLDQGTQRDLGVERHLHAVVATELVIVAGALHGFTVPPLRLSE